MEVREVVAVLVLPLVLDSVKVEMDLEVEVDDEIEVEVEVLALVDVAGFGITLNDIVAPHSDNGVPSTQHPLFVQ